MKSQLSFILMSMLAFFFAMPSSAELMKDEDGVVFDRSTLQILPFIGFACETRRLGEDRKRVPITVGYTSTSQGVVIYKWVRDYYSESAETPLEICSRVSAIFDILRQEDLIETIAIGIDENKIQSVCAGVTCNRPIFNLLPDENPEEVIEDLYLALTRVPSEPGEAMREENPSGVQINENRNLDTEDSIIFDTNRPRPSNIFNNIFQETRRRSVVFDRTRSGGSR
ncbi:COP23 domain-containing protein [Nodosilinea sp. P-1105]|uniref:COP23 domain-containing protein n=1 Tax=Nodosilinea sp. P-1105 TaxID=2546229 RepID=UPI00146DDC48|nr:COP23 domain-containing protein [Nodosilinea sp. P-1105]NMF82154.1 hypothetical protein [Nodosilinea sp. P-1105]